MVGALVESAWGGRGSFYVYARPRARGRVCVLAMKWVLQALGGLLKTAFKFVLRARDKMKEKEGRKFGAWTLVE